MHLLFVDESGRPEDKTFAVGGAVVRADEWSVVRNRWQQALAEHSWPHDKEIKWHGTRTGEVPPALADSVFAALAGAPLTCYVVLLRPLAGRQSHPGFLRDGPGHLRHCADVPRRALSAVPLARRLKRRHRARQPPVRSR